VFWIFCLPRYDRRFYLATYVKFGIYIPPTLPSRNVHSYQSESDQPWNRGIHYPFNNNLRLLFHIKMSKVFVIFGATGKQGGSLLQYILNHPELSKTYRLRAVTRDATKHAAKEMAGKGVEVVEVGFKSLRKS
jgi:NmrA-like family